MHSPRHVRTMYEVGGLAWTKCSNKSGKETQIIEQTIFKKREKDEQSKHMHVDAALPFLTSP